MSVHTTVMLLYETGVDVFRWWRQSWSGVNALFLAGRELVLTCSDGEDSLGLVLMPGVNVCVLSW